MVPHLTFSHYSKLTVENSFSFFPPVLRNLALRTSEVEELEYSVRDKKKKNSKSNFSEENEWTTSSSLESEN